MSKLYLTIGFVGSGKSTWARKMAAENPKVKIVCPDDIRRMLNGRYVYEKKLDSVIDDIASAVEDYLLRDGYDVIIDCCNLTLARRKLWLDMLFDAEIIVVIFPQKDKKWHIDNRMKESHGNVSREECERIYDLHVSQYEPIVENRFDKIISV